MKSIKIFLAIFILVCIPPLLSKDRRNRRATVYVPVYSSVYHSDLKGQIHLAVTLSIHNIDYNNAIVIDSILYYNADGRVIHDYSKDKIVLKPMETYNLGIKESDKRAGVGANFIVKWHSRYQVDAPLIETIMIGTRGQQGISFTSRGVVIKD